jgi:hypothetical protein
MEGYVSLLMLILHVWTANYPTVKAVALCHTQTVWTPLRHSGGLQVSCGVTYSIQDTAYSIQHTAYT